MQTDQTQQTQRLTVRVIDNRVCIADLVDGLDEETYVAMNMEHDMDGAGWPGPKLIFVDRFLRGRGWSRLDTMDSTKAAWEFTR